MSEPLSLLRTTDDLDAAFDESLRRPVLVFKHSLTCSVSDWALRELERALDGSSPQARVLVLEIQRHRDLSNEVARRTGVRHESPQAILLVDAEPAWNASHWRLDAAGLREVLTGTASD